jgi:uncharacterized membrane protein YozB (DUF420 family)
MEGLRSTPGFLDTGANILADLNLIVQLLFYIVICLGVVVQLRKQYKWHDRLQIPVVLLNLLFIAVVMLPSFLGILPQLPNRFSETAFVVPTLHAILGLLAEGISIYCLLAGLKILPRKIGILRYWMWTAFVLWTLTILFGIGLYLVWYTGSSAGSATEPAAEHQADLVAEHDMAAMAPPTVEVVEEHAAEPMTVPPTEAPTEPVSEHAAETVVVEPTATPTVTPTPVVPIATPTLTPAPGRVGLLIFSDNAAHSDQVNLSLLSVSPPPTGLVYEAWLTGDDLSPFSMGQLTLADDAITHTFTDPSGRNLLALYRRAFITIEPANDTDPTPAATIVFAGELPPQVVGPVRLVAAASPNTPDGDGLALNTLAEAEALLKIAQVQPDFVADDNLAELKVHAEAALNLLEGAGSPDFGDRDGDGEVFNPGDGLGLLGSEGYLSNIMAQAGQAGQSPGAGELVKLHAGHVEAAAQNILDWADQIKELELKILSASDTASAAADTAKTLELAQAILAGADANNDGRVDPIPDEGGAQTLYEHALLMAGIELMPVSELPAVAPAAEDTPTPQPTSTPIPQPTVTPLPIPTATPELLDEHASEPVSEHDAN